MADTQGFFFPDNTPEQAQLLRQQLLAKQLMDGGQSDQATGAYGGLANAGKMLAGALLSKRLGDKAKDLETQREGSYSKALGNFLSPFNYGGAPNADTGVPDNVNVSPQASADNAGQLGSSMGSRLAATGNPDLIRLAAPQLMAQQLQANAPNAPITPYQQTEIDARKAQMAEEARQHDPAYLQSAAAAQAAGRAAAPISAVEQAQLDAGKARDAETARTHDPNYLGQVAGAQANARLPAAIAEAKAKSEAANQPYDPDTIHFMAQQALSGDKSVFQQLGYGGAGQANRAALRNEVTKMGMQQGMSGRDLAALNAEFVGLTAGERTLGNRTANIEMAANEAQQMVPLALAASQAVNRTQYPTLNSILMAAEKGTGDENVVRLGIATNSLINIYARAISPTGVPTVSDKDHARELLEGAWSKGQFAAGLNQFGKELSAARSSPGVVRGEFRNAVGAGGQKGIAPVPGAPEQPIPGGAPISAATKPTAQFRYDPNGNRVSQ